MNVLLINGSPHPKGCTYTALRLVSDELEDAGISTEIMHIGTKPISGCTGCGSCYRNGHRCVIDDLVNETLDRMKDVDGLVIGSPTHYASPAGNLISFLDRLFYAGSDDLFAYKPAAVVASARRAGTTATLDVLQKYPSIAQMPMVTSKYWNMIHGNTPEEALQDKEGVQTMQMVGRNMAWLLSCIEAGRSEGIALPDRVMPKEWTNFIR